MDEVECVVIGAGVIGLAAARAIAQSGREVLIVEAENRFGMGTSSRNSEVIHAGIYYPQGSLKAQFCVRGREMLYAHCASHDVAHQRCGKLIVAANDAQIDELKKIKQAAERNGVFDLQWLDRAQAQALEPNLHCTAALLSPSTGIIDSHGYMLSLLGDAEAAGAMIAYSSAVADIVLDDEGRAALTFAGQDEPSISARLVVNAAGLLAPRVAAAMDGFPDEHVPQAFYAKGNYFTLPGRAPFSRLVYPVPEPGGLGVHLTLDLGGQARFGPDVEWIDRPGDYNVDPKRCEKFYAAIRAYWPDLEDGLLQPAYSGIRPKLSGPGAPNADFRIDGPAQHGAPGVINLFGIELPGLTSSLAIAEHVARIAGEVFDA